jgi:uncharacterized protein YfaS (alpha-2-macroglobulin family)
MFRFLRVFWILLLATAATAFSQDRYAELQQQAARYYSEQSYAQAHQAWSEAAKLDVPAADRPTLDFYLADSLWRSRPGAEQVAEARAGLERLAKGADALSAEAAESLGDSWLAIEGDWDRAWSEYQRALKFWAASTDLEAARSRYLGIVWKATGPPTSGQSVRRVPRGVLENALLVAASNEERARAHFFLGRWDMEAEDAYARHCAGREFQTAVDAGKDTAVYEAALFQLAEWNLVAGEAKWNAKGALEIGPDYDRALEGFQRFVKEFPKGQSGFHDRAQARIDALAKPLLEVRAESDCVSPGARPALTLAWRNAGEVRLTLSRVDLSDAFKPGARTEPAHWLDAVTPGVALREWTETPTGGQEHAPREKRVEMDALAEPGAYLVEARAGSLTARALIVATNAAAVLESAGSQALAWFCDAQTGTRAPEATAKLWQATRTENGWRWQAVEGAPAKDGLVSFPLRLRKEEGLSLLLLGGVGGQPVVATGEASALARKPGGWRVEAFADRADYRPSDTMHWKMIVRTRGTDALATPAGEVLKFAILGPDGVRVDAGEVKLTAFGGAWGSLELKPEWKPGAYEIAVFRGEEQIARRPLFHLAEARQTGLEARVSIANESALRPGDELRATVAARGDSGRPIADAKVEVSVREEAIAADATTPRAEARVVKTETLRTGPEGTADLRVPTTFTGSADLRYTIEARVTDARGREATGAESVIASRQGYFVELKPSRRVVQPKEAVGIAIGTRDANGRAANVSGELTVTRRKWTETWLDPKGRTVSGAELDKLRHGVFPPAGEAGWRLLRQGYTDEEVARAPLATDAEGRAEYTFRPDAAGFYRAAWSGSGNGGPVVKASTGVWVSAGAGALLDYHAKGVEVIADPVAPGGGGAMPVLIVSDTPDCDVLLLVHAAGSLLRSEVLHLDGDSRLVTLESDPRFVPNVFVTAIAVRGRSSFADTREIQFPPFQNALSLELRPRDAIVAPGGEGVFDIVAKDDKGVPVSCELALDVTANAGGEAGNPLEFFYGGARPNALGLASSLPLSLGAETPSSGFPRANGGEPAESLTAFWLPGIVTGPDGRATVRFKYPDVPAAWRAVARGASAGADFGFAEAATRTAKPVLARLKAPDDLLVGDKVEISGVVENRAGSGLAARVDLRADGLAGPMRSQTLEISPRSEAHASWKLDAEAPGQARLTLGVSTPAGNESASAAFPIFPGGLEQSLSVSGRADADAAQWRLDLPAQRESTALIATATPSLAGVVLDAVPDLVRHSYDGVEQTMSQFLPAAVTVRTLEALGMDRRAVANRLFSGVEPGFLAQTHAAMAGDAGIEELNALAARSLARLRDMQHADGAWGWWKEGDDDVFMSAYVVWGLRLAQQAGVPVRSDMLERGIAWLRKNLAGTAATPNLQAWMLRALAAQHAGKPTREERAAIDQLWSARDGLAPEGRALFALAAHDFGQQDLARTLARALHDGATRETQSDSPMAHWGDVNATAVALEALLAIDPKNDLIGPAVNWLAQARDGAHWSSPRDTALAVLALDDWLSVAKEPTRPVSFEILVNGKKAAGARGATALEGASRFALDPALLRDGANEIALRRTEGEGPIYFSARAGFVTSGQPIAAVANGIAVKRVYFRDAPRLTLLDGWQFDLAPWKEGESAFVGERVEVEITVTTESDLESVLVEDGRPAGLGISSLHGGEILDATGADGRSVRAHCQLREGRVAFLLRRLPKGTWTLRYDLRAETPGDFLALPASGRAMNAPEIRGNSESRRVTIEAGK